MKEFRRKTIADRESSYQAQRLNRMLSPPRADPFADRTPARDERTYADSLVETQLQKELRVRASRAGALLVCAGTHRSCRTVYLVCVADAR